MNALLMELLSALHRCPAHADFDSDLVHYRAVAAWWKVEIAPRVKEIDQRLDQRQRQAEAGAKLALEIARLPPNQGGHLLGLAL
jgi:hypothetical protein